MPGTPATSPNFAIPRFSNADAADFAADVNSVVDAIDVNAIGSHWIYRTLASGTGTAVSGDFWVAAGGSTVNLPSPTAGRSVAVQADPSATGSSQVTVATASGSIRGLGLGTVLASIKLGTPGASVVLVADGTNWRIVAGQQDTGWVALTLPSGFTTSYSGGSVASARLLGDRVWLRGAVNNASGSTLTHPGTFATAPSSTMFPTASRYFAVPLISSPMTTALATIGNGTGGLILLQTDLVSTGGGIVSLDGLSYVL